MKKVVVTGSEGLLGWHARARLHAANCAAIFAGKVSPYHIVSVNHAQFEDDEALCESLHGAEIVLHFAGVNRAPDHELEVTNPAIARRVVEISRQVGAQPHIVYANSTHSDQDTPYGRSKRIAGDILSDGFPHYTNLVLPHIFGEAARPFYNNVTATLIAQILQGTAPSLNPDGKVSLLHAGEAAQIAIDAATTGLVGRVNPTAVPMSVPALHEKLSDFHAQYQRGIFPDLAEKFDRDLFNAYRAATYPSGWPRPLKQNTDSRGTLFEAVKGGGGGQTFFSTTRPGVTRGDHFHLNKVERFLVVQGEAVIRMRKVLSDEVWEFRVSGDAPALVDMPTLHTHSIENVGEGDLLTLFWTHDLFDPANPDTYADRVLK